MNDHHDFNNRLRAWSYCRQHLDRSDTEACDLLRHLVAVYSSHPSGPLTLHSRTTLMAPETIQVWEEQRAAVRIPAMRGSIFLVPTEFAPDVFAATRKSSSQLLAGLRYAGLTVSDYEALKPRLLASLQEPTPVNEIKRAHRDAEQVMRAVRTMANEGLLLRLGGSLRRDDLRYVTTETWLGAPIHDADPDRALQWLADAYLRVFGPARVEDFAWWSGCTIRKARVAINACEVVEVGHGYLLPIDLGNEFASISSLAPDSVTVVPKWDAYTMGYAPDGRQRWIDDIHLIKAFTLLGRPVESGDALPLVLLAGRAVASWSHRFEGTRLLATVKPFGQIALSVIDRFERIGELFGTNDVQVTIEKPTV